MEYTISQLLNEYELKRAQIKQRLDDFNKFFNEPYSWFYSNNEMKLVQVDADDDCRLFEELCFCIFTANASAEMGLKAVDAVRPILVDGSAVDMTKRLEGIYRFNNIRPAYIAHTRGYLKTNFNFELKSKVKSFEDMQQLRDFFAANKDIKGLGYKEASHFLRNIGFRGYAILDMHIINSLYEFGILENNDRPKNRNEYLGIEKKIREFADEIEIDMDELDLLLWSRKNGRILK